MQKGEEAAAAPILGAGAVATVTAGATGTVFFSFHLSVR